MICINSLKAAAHNNFNGFYFDWSQNACVKIVWQLGEPIFLFFCIYWKIINWIFGFNFHRFGCQSCSKSIFSFQHSASVVRRWLTSIVITTPGGGTSLNKPYRFVPHQKVCFLCRYSLKTGKDFTHFGLESGMAFEGTTGVYERIFCFKSKWKRNREKYANSKWILRIFLLTFWSKYEWWHNFCLGRSEKGCGNDIFMVWNRVRIWGIRWYSSTKNS